MSKLVTKIYLSVDDIRDLNKLPLLGEYETDSLSGAFHKARKQYPHFDKYAFVGGPTKRIK